jgi:hypothetical protein
MMDACLTSMIEPLEAFPTLIGGVIAIGACHLHIYGGRFGSLMIFFPLGGDFPTLSSPMLTGSTHAMALGGSPLFFTFIFEGFDGFWPLGR